MKRLFISILCYILICSYIVPCLASASGTQIETNADGSFIVISNEPPDFSVYPPNFGDETAPETPQLNSMGSIIELLKSFIDKLINLFRQLQGKEEITKSKYIYYYSADSKLLWLGKLTGQFLYSSDSVSCIDASFAFESYDSNWKLDTYNCSTKNATAEVRFSVVQKSLGVKLQTINKSLSLTCDTNGNVS